MSSNGIDINEIYIITKIYQYITFDYYFITTWETDGFSVSRSNLLCRFSIDKIKLKQIQNIINKLNGEFGEVFELTIKQTAVNLILEVYIEVKNRKELDNIAFLLKVRYSHAI